MASKKVKPVTRAEVETMVSKMGQAVIATCADAISKQQHSGLGNGAKPLDPPSFSHELYRDNAKRTTEVCADPIKKSALDVAFDALSVTVDCVIKEVAELASKIQPVLARQDDKPRPVVYSGAQLNEGDSFVTERVIGIQSSIASLANEVADLKARVQL